MQIAATLPVRHSSISAVVTRADGTVENYGMIAYWHRNPVIRWTVNAYLFFKGKLK